MKQRPAMKEKKNMKKQNRVILDEVKLWKCVTFVSKKYCIDECIQP